ncbi:carboxymuconolactone decarboxylase family protein [Psychromarinibacter sp. C21-152]|uniref:Carboxymuconolactone decarboxylase family protein n=1 Tax=Psychromarinibacter sediminicola TaxID=3033385 RepID=A0AAE3NSQ2_9RHOB|nr:carboxymuconolactone decarboxylase family protein [Psychromarinibacter sediminicola]MDF0601377.1 carboxymuconolactone decarboxylase family protein [Psychromarinibacter sediminicola]
MGRGTDSRSENGRISFPEPGSMTEEQTAVYNQIVAGPRQTLVGPLRAALHNPVLADRWQRLGQVLRFETCLPTRLNELAILVTAKRWNSPLEWAIHKADALRVGLDPAIAEAIRVGELPEFGDDDAAREIYEFARQLVKTADVDSATYAAIVERWGEVGAVELTAVVGYYSMVAMTLNVHRVPLPDGVEDNLPGANSALPEIPATKPVSG